MDLAISGPTEFNLYAHKMPSSLQEKNLYHSDESISCLGVVVNVFTFTIFVKAIPVSKQRSFLPGLIILQNFSGSNTF